MKTKNDRVFEVTIKHSHRYSTTLVEAEIQRMINKHSAIICLDAKLKEEPEDDKSRTEEVSS